MAKRGFKFTTEQILVIQKSFCKRYKPAVGFADRSKRWKKPKRTHRVPHPECVAKEMKEREKRGETIRATFFDDLVCGNEKLKYVEC